MPNGGTDCCVTCWFNRANKGRAGSVNHDHTVRSHCEIRDTPIEDPYSTYCANHPYRRPERDPIPIGPILRPGTPSPETPEISPTTLDTGTGHPARVVWRCPPDTGAIRAHLVGILEDLERQAAKDGYFPSPGLAATVIWQLGQYREWRAVPGLRRILKRHGGRIAHDARMALRRIRQRPEEFQPCEDAVRAREMEGIVGEVLNWLRETYASHRFFERRDVVWTVHKRLLEVMSRSSFPYRVLRESRIVSRDRRKSESPELMLVDGQERVLAAIELQYRPNAGRARNDYSPYDFLHLDLSEVRRDAMRVRQLVQQGFVPYAVSVFIDEGENVEIRRLPGRWEDWSRGGGGYPVRARISEFSGPV